MGDMVKTQLLIVVCLAVAGAAGGLSAADVDRQLETLFGDEIRRAARTPGLRDDAELAAMFLKAGEMLADQGNLKLLLYEKAAEFGSKDAAGYEAAMKAVNLLVKTAPDRKADWEARRLDICRTRYMRARGTARAAAAKTYLDQLVSLGDIKSAAGQATEAVALYRQAMSLAGSYRSERKGEIAGKVKSAGEQVVAEQRCNLLKARLDKDPSNASVREQLVMLELLELDSPARAAKLLNDDVDEYLRRYVPMAAGPIDKTAEAACLELGKWYTQFIDKGGTALAKGNALVRAYRYYRQFLKVHEGKDVKRLAADLAMKRLKERAKKMGVKLPGGLGQPKWVDVLKLVDPAKHAVDGRWIRRGAELACVASGRGLIATPASAAGGYDLQVAFTLKEGHESNVLMPVGAGCVAVVLGGWKGTCSGLACIEERTPNDGNPTTIRSTVKQGLFRVGTRVVLDIRVRLRGELAEIAVALDGRKIIAWSGKQPSLSLPESWTMPGERFGLGTYASTVVWHSVRLRLLDPIDRTLKLVSKDAAFKLSSVYSRSPPLPAFLTGEGKLYEEGAYAIHTDQEVKPHVTIALKKAAPIKRIVIQNRRDNYGEHTVGLAAAASVDGRAWQTIWRATEVRKVWTIDLKTPVKARFIRIGLTGEKKAYLHLAGVRIYAATEE